MVQKTRVIFGLVELLFHLVNHMEVGPSHSLISRDSVIEFTNGSLLDIKRLGLLSKSSCCRRIEVGVPLQLDELTYEEVASMTRSCGTKTSLLARTFSSWEGASIRSLTVDRDRGVTNKVDAAGNLFVSS